MDNKLFIKVINDSLVPYGFKKKGRNIWIKNGKEVSVKIHLQRSSYSHLYYFRLYYVINNLPLKGCTTDYVGHCFAHTNLKEADIKSLSKMCDLEYNVTDDYRINTLRNLINKAFSNSQLIETEEELKKMLIEEDTAIFVVVKKYLGIL